MTKRGYQLGFYAAWQGVRDAAARSRKAGKIAYALRTLHGADLEAAIGLDIGCSSGLVTAALAPLFGRLIGAEYDPEALAAATPGDPASLAFVRADAMRLPFADNALEVVICAQVYEHVPDDRLLASEVFRVLKPGGVVFFSGPNKLFPIEPHYFLPFLHWLPERWADAYLRLTGRGAHYYERSRTMWGLRRLWAQFNIHDIGAVLLSSAPDSMMSPRWARLASRLPLAAWRMCLPFLPNFNWLLTKPPAPASAAPPQ
jgi:SAM-dependent methyltransferase